MNREKKIILIGGGGHCKSCIDVIEQEGSFIIVGITDQADKIGENILSYSILSDDDAIPKLAAEHQFLITIGHIRSAEPRVRLYKALLAAKGDLVTVISPRAYVSPHAEIGKGTIVMHGATVNAGAKVGNNCIINSHALVEHDAMISDHCHIATGAIINGGVQVGAQTFVGSRAMTREYITIGAGSFIAGGMSIYQDLQEQSRVKPK